MLAGGTAVSAVLGTIRRRSTVNPVILFLHIARHGRDARASASESVPSQRGASPLRANVLRPVTEGNCVAARPGGEQLEVNDQSETQVNSIRPDGVASPLVIGEAQTRNRSRREARQAEG
jgi:hypothetical protein